ncbi:hypothetical protein PG996_013970 [Apiospora saccharicola]|uniref:Uncharacterized protein n=1 Tax=Apiospora saccharicola TaxID=335842 RepID=A0ABR1TIW9_9PEZI
MLREGHAISGKFQHPYLAIEPLTLQMTRAAAPIKPDTVSSSEEILATWEAFEKAKQEELEKATANPLTSALRIPSSCVAHGP